MEKAYMLIIYVIIFIMGACIGSFLNVCIYRIPRKESIVFPPSHCTNCNMRIKWYDLIPILSYVLIGGKCRNCKEKISIIYPLIELLLGVLFVLLFYLYGFNYEFYKYSILICILSVVGIIDFNTTDVYFNTIVFGAISGLAFLAYEYFLNGIFLNYLIAGATAWGVIALIILITNGMGWGDAEICLVCGIYLGFSKTILMLFMSFVIGAAVGLILIALGKKTRKDYIPFGPWIAVSSVITIFLGDGIINWYLHKF